ncbi:hypothetical protein GRI58_03645 [Porphyrobacter algicida]|uniref:Uncharacterized protein n=1 Tax=Qipengyuania algicida TaxID=1836209 RepID=A0A845AGG9_9SPHN|nr:hypothetical protein [Qipengyuania algicida]MXP27915.1 hypothetical protein [Qipengyuania algicida]
MITLKIRGDIMRWPIIVMIGLMSQPAFAQADLLLICKGNMRGMFKDRRVGAVVADNDGHAATGGASSSRYSDIPTTAMFELTNGKARLNLPQPPTCAICVGEKGWREVKDLRIEPDRISGRIHYGMLSGTEFEIDRRTGIMTSKNGFTGTCEKQDATKTRF